MSTFSPPPRLGRILDAQVSAADVRIEGMQIRSRRVTRSRVTHDISIDIKSDNDDWAHNVRCVVVLPPTAHLIALDPPALTGPAFPALGDADHAVQSEPTTGFVVFEPSEPLKVGEQVTLQLTVSVHLSYSNQPIAAFVYSDNPDPDPSNNFRSVTPPDPRVP